MPTTKLIVETILKAWGGVPERPFCQTSYDDVTDDPVDPEPFEQFDAEGEEFAERWIEQMGLEGDEAERFRDHGKHWILIDGEPVAVGLLEWARWFEDHDHRIVGRDDVKAPDGATYQVSTVFLGLDHSFGMGTRPLLFETMIFKLHTPRMVWWQLFGRHKLQTREAEDYQMRYSTLPEAEIGHKMAMEYVRAGDWDSPMYE